MAVRKPLEKPIPRNLGAALALIASALALCVMAGCSGPTDAFHTCDNCNNSYNGGHVEQASCGHWFCDLHDECKDAFEEHEALAEGTPALECGAELHYRCDGHDHSQAACGTDGHFSCSRADHGVPACGIKGHFGCDGLPHTWATCYVDGHFACDGADHGLFICFDPEAEEELEPEEARPEPAAAPQHRHFGGTATCLVRATCSGCGRTYGGADPANHDAACAFAEATPCSHDAHDGSCGHAEAAEAVPCAHECSVESGCATWLYVPGSACGHDHDATCAITQGGHDEAACTCSSGCEGGCYVSDGDESSWVPCGCGCWSDDI